ncbi:MAG: NAD(P)/FAD-dependent oxidoreductase [Solirubrobacterales bacterium]|nr:NAD(P)/FAD-dependent oxidoreductase [Solirubrobacterales bacterium]
MTEPNPTITPENPVVVLGGGPAGLTAGYLMAKRGQPVLVLEATDMLGGIARTEIRNGYRFDLGGHRFFTKATEVNELWDEIMGDEFLQRPRMSRIYWNKKFLDYPLQGMDVIKKLGPFELMRAGLSYLWAAITPKGPEDNLEQWVSNRFGKRLYTLFFKSYTEKVWGVPCTEIQAEWAAQRIKGLSFFSAAKAAFMGNKDNKIKSLIDSFNYPRFGPGQMWERMSEKIVERGGEVRMNAPVSKINVRDGQVVSVIAGGVEIPCSHVVSSLALRNTVGFADPELSPEIRDAAKGLRYRDFLTVGLVLEVDDVVNEPFPDNWIYIHDPEVTAGRIQNFRSWSPWMVPDPDVNETCIGLEYFCFEGDELWEMADEDLVELGKRELNQLGLGDSSRVKQGFAVRVEKAYPMYDPDYDVRVGVIRDWLETVPNLVQVGRNGLHRYNNSDHSMLTSMRAVENILDGAGHDIWAVNAESAYHEEDEDPKEIQPYINVPTPKSMEKPLSE